MRYAVISDIHGNALALEAVLEDIGRRRVDAILNLGDVVYGPLDPAGTMRLLADAERLAPVYTIRGNQDRLYDHQGMSHDYTHSQLTPEQVAALSGLPATRTVHGMLLCHGTPSHDMTYLLERVTADGVHLRGMTEIQALLGDTTRGVVLCGHTHIPRTVQVNEECLVINPGSVGLPAYTDDQPYAHVMQTGSPHARYAITNGASVEQIALDYNWLGASEQAKKNNRPDWAFALRTGYGLTIRTASEQDLAAICGLLEQNRLARPAAEQISFVVAESNGEILGIAGVESYGKSALLRSVAVQDKWRSLGIGRFLAQERIRCSGAEQIFLLTDTAADYWARFGFRAIGREEAPEEIRRSHEFQHACPASATLMRAEASGKSHAGAAR
jgi:putative phosphoesterase